MGAIQTSTGFRPVDLRIVAGRSTGRRDSRPEAVLLKRRHDVGVANRCQILKRYAPQCSTSDFSRHKEPNLARPVTARSGGGCYPDRTAKIVNRGARRSLHEPVRSMEFLQTKPSRARDNVGNGGGNLEISVSRSTLCRHRTNFRKNKCLRDWEGGSVSALW